MVRGGMDPLREPADAAVREVERPCDDEVDRLGRFDRGAALTLPIAAHTRLLVEDAFRDAPEAAFAPARTV